MAFRQITFGSADYRKECELRHEVLRAPLGLSLYDEDLSREQQQMHFGLFEQNNQLVACVIAVAVSSSEAKIRQMAVARDHQGKGHGRSIINSLEEHLAQQGYRRIALFGEHGGTGDIEYRAWFADQARMQGVHVAFEHILERRPADGELDPILVDVRDRIAPDAVVYMGTGWCTPAFNAALGRIGWDPPRVCNAAFMWAPHDEAWMRALEGWTGIDQLTGPDGPEANHNYNSLLDRFEARFDRRVDHVVIALAYDMARVVAEAIVHAPMLNGRGMKLGLERIKMFPSAIGGRATNITFGAQDHRGYKGDFLVMRQLVNQRYVYRGGLDPRHRIGD